MGSHNKKARQRKLNGLFYYASWEGFSKTRPNGVRQKA